MSAVRSGSGIHGSVCPHSTPSTPPPLSGETERISEVLSEANRTSCAPTCRYVCLARASPGWATFTQLLARNATGDGWINWCVVAASADKNKPAELLSKRCLPMVLRFIYLGQLCTLFSIIVVRLRVCLGNYAWLYMWFKTLSCMCCVPFVLRKIDSITPHKWVGRQ